MPDEQERRGQVGDQEVLRHVRRQQVLGEPVDRREQPDRGERDAAVPGDLLPERHVVAARAQHVHGAEVQDLREQDSDYGAGVHQRSGYAVATASAASPIGFSAGAASFSTSAASFILSM